MNLNEILNNDTIKEIEGYLALQNAPGLILQGIGGLGKAKVANFVSASILGCSEEDLINNPDYFQTDPSKSIKVEDINALLDIANRSSIGNKKIIVIHNAHTMTLQTQNRLLKLLEDRYKTNTVILHTQKDVLIDTIKSRCYSIFFHPLSEDKMKRYLSHKKLDDKYHDFLSFLVENSPLMIDEHMEVLNDYIAMYEKMSSLTMREDLLNIFHCLKEKDNDEFYSGHSEFPTWNIRLLLFFFYRMVTNVVLEKKSDSKFPANLYSYEQAYQILLHGMEHMTLADNMYTKNDYFNFIRYIIQIS